MIHRFQSPLVREKILENVYQSNRRQENRKKMFSNKFKMYFLMCSGHLWLLTSLYSKPQSETHQKIYYNHLQFIFIFFLRGEDSKDNLNEIKITWKNLTKIVSVAQNIIILYDKRLLGNKQFQRKEVFLEKIETMYTSQEQLYKVFHIKKT